MSIEDKEISGKEVLDKVKEASKGVCNFAYQKAKGTQFLQKVTKKIQTAVEEFQSDSGDD